VLETKVGYTGGTVPNPTYKLVCTELRAMPKRLRLVSIRRSSVTKICSLTFFRMHDPTTLNQQHNDRGTQYRSAIFYHTEEQKQIAEKVKARVDKSGAWKKPVVTEITESDAVLRRRGLSPEIPHQEPRRLQLPRNET